MALPISASAGDACFSASDELWKRVVVRNTFIDLADELPEGRRPRSSSAPAPLRLRQPCPGGDCCGGLPEEDASTDGGETGSFADSASAADGGETGSLADSSSAVEADAMSVADSEQAACQQAREPPPRVPPGAFLALPGGGGSRQGQRLCSSAKAFTPSAPTPATPPGTRRFRRDLQALANAVKGVLEGCSDLVVGAEAGYSPQGWFVSASISPQNLHARERLLTRAKEAICGAQMRHSRVMGCGAQPFQTTPLGFAARIGHVPDEEKACWNLIQHGFCRYGEFCHWQHPSVQTILSVKVIVVAE